MGKYNNRNNKPRRNLEIEYFRKNALKLKNESTNYDEFCDNAKNYAYVLKNNRVTTSMIRKIYSRILNADEVKSIKMLRPQFAYLAGRNEKNYGLKDFMDLLDFLAKEMKTEEELDSFKQFMEAIVAYRKYVGSDK